MSQPMQLFLPDHDATLTDRTECAIRARLRETSYLELRRISWTLQDRVLRLEGFVSSYYLRQIAQTLVAGLNGVDIIDNQLEVLSNRLRPRQPSFVTSG